MKLFIILLLMFSMFSFTNAQEGSLIGTWEIIEFGTAGEGVSNVKDEAKLKEDESVWTIKLDDMEEFTQTSNMRTGDMETHSGEWTVEEDQLIMEFLIDGNKLKIIYNFILEDDVLTLSRSNPKGTMTITVKFSKN